jgi:hypothetical protein
MADSDRQRATCLVAVSPSDMLQSFPIRPYQPCKLHCIPLTHPIRSPEHDQCHQYPKPSTCCRPPLQIAKLLIIPFVCLIERFYLGRTFTRETVATIFVVIVGVAIV